MLKWISNIFKALNANSNPATIAHAFSLGVLLGFMPKTNVLWYLIFIFFLFVRIHKSTYCIVLLITTYFAWMLDPLFSSMGYSILTYPKFENFFASAIEIPFVGFTKFNNTVVMGSLAFGLMIYIPVFILVYFFVKFWRKRVAPKFIKSPLQKALQKLPVLGKLFEVVEDKI